MINAKHDGRGKYISAWFISVEMVAVLDFRALVKVYNFKTASSNAVKSCTHIEDIVMKCFFFSFVE